MDLSSFLFDSDDDGNGNEQEGDIDISFSRLGLLDEPRVDEIFDLGSIGSFLSLDGDDFNYENPEADPEEPEEGQHPFRPRGRDASVVQSTSAKGQQS